MDPPFQNLAENRFIRYDQDNNASASTLGRNVFRPKLSQPFGQASRGRWREPEARHPIDSEQVEDDADKNGGDEDDSGDADEEDAKAKAGSTRSRQKERMRKELAAVFRLARSSSELVHGKKNTFIKRHMEIVNFILFCSVPAKNRPQRESDEDAHILVSPKKVLFIRT